MSRLALKFKVWRIERALRRTLRAEGVSPGVWSFGAYYIDPKHMVFVVGVETDEEKRRLRGSDSFRTEVRRLLERFAWPEEARQHVVFDIESEETVQRETRGNWWYHYK